MRAFILAGLFSLSAFAADAPPSDGVIQQRMVGTWRLNWHILQSTTTIGTNGDYVRFDVSNDAHPQTNWYEGTINIRDGLWIDTLKKSSVTNQPVPHVFTNVIIRVTDRELLYRAQNESQQILLEKVRR
jgi:hypothetical protein